MQIATLESERDALNRRIRGLQKEMEDGRAKMDTASTATQEAIAAAVASSKQSVEDLKATDMRIISEVFTLCMYATHDSVACYWSLPILS